jgi:hypothetical protein
MAGFAFLIQLLTFLCIKSRIAHTYPQRLRGATSHRRSCAMLHPQAPKPTCILGPVSSMRLVQQASVNRILSARKMQVFASKRPYHGYHHCHGVTKVISHGHCVLDRPLEISSELWRIIQMCWKINPEDRPAMHEVESRLRGL